MESICLLSRPAGLSEGFSRRIRRSSSCSPPSSLDQGEALPPADVLLRMWSTLLAALATFVALNAALLVHCVSKKKTTPAALPRKRNVPPAPASKVASANSRDSLQKAELPKAPQKPPPSEKPAEEQKKEAQEKSKKDSKSEQSKSAEEPPKDTQEKSEKAEPKEEARKEAPKEEVRPLEGVTFEERGHGCAGRGEAAGASRRQGREDRVEEGAEGRQD